ncbi:MAG: hypothetical protein HRU69_06840 [Flammeovirgaceae bacterium]|nr:MAG: hypothetical protein HRU69_06840 [Flammeovirgaceae bacterium]
MKNYRWTIVLFFLITTSVAFAQTYAFKVLVSKGKTEVKSGEAWSAIKVGANLNASDEVKVAENSYLGLMHASGKPLEVKEAGNYNLADLAARLSKGSTVLNKYTDFILSSEEDKKNKLAATGAVHRDVKMALTVFLPQTSEHFGDKLAVSWQNPGASTQADVIVMDLGEDELARYKVDGNSLLIDLNDPKLKGTQHYLIRVVSKDGNESARCGIKRLRGNRKTEVETAWNEVNTSFGEQTALELYVQAGFFEQNLLLTDALTAYKQAADMAPEVDMYRESYEAFLQRLGFKK